MIADLFSLLEQITNNNSMAVAGIGTTLTASFMYAVKSVPAWTFNKIKRYSITSLTIDSTKNTPLYCRVLSYIYEQTTQAKMMRPRNIGVESVYDRGSDRTVWIPSAGYGSFLFKFNKRWIYASIYRLDSSGADIQKKELTLTMLGSDNSTLLKLVNDSYDIYYDETKVKLAQYSSDGWLNQPPIPCRLLDTLALDNEVKTFFKREVDFFLNHKEDYHRLGLPHKLTCLLHGPPGTGKTNLVKAIASEYGLTICELSLVSLSDEKLARAFRTLPDKSIVLIEDIDANNASYSRKPEGTHNDSTTLTSMLDLEAPLSLSGVLNVLDGITSLDGVMIFMTTNHIEQLDEALLRPGRVDIKYKLPKISAKAVKEHLEIIYPSLKNENIQYPSLYAKDINAIIYRAKLDSDQIKRDLREYYIQETGELCKC